MIGFQEIGDQACPAGLMGRADAAPVVTVEVLVEQDAVAKMGIASSRLMMLEDRTAPGFILQENARQAASQFVRDFANGQVSRRAGRTLDLEIVAVILVELLQRFDEQVVDGHPDRPPPVRVSTEEAGNGFRGLITDTDFIATTAEHVGMRLVDLRDGAHAVIRKEFGLIEHPAEKTLHTMPAKE